MDRKDLLKKLEEEVAVIKDPELKKIAFEKLLGQEIGEPVIKKEVMKKRKAKKARKAKVKGKSSASQYFSIEQVGEKVKKMNITGKVKDLIPYKLCKKGWEKCFWVLAAAKQSKIEGLNNHEVAYILNKRLYTQVKYSTVNNIRKKVSSGLVMFDHDENVWKLAPDGEEALKKIANKKPKGNK